MIKTSLKYGCPQYNIIVNYINDNNLQRDIDYYTSYSNINNITYKRYYFKETIHEKLIQLLLL